MEEGESVLRQEDCNEDTLGLGILILTTKRVAFDKTKSRIIDFTKRFGETVLDVKHSDITNVWKEGIFMKKVCMTANIDGESKSFKFGVLGTGSWLEAIQDAAGITPQ